jgi:hypothetical protein
VNNLVHEILDIQTFLNFKMKKNTFLKNFLGLLGLDRATYRALHDNTRTVDIMVAAGGIYLHRILQKARRNPNELANNPTRHVGSRG